MCSQFVTLLSLHALTENLKVSLLSHVGQKYTNNVKYIHSVCRVKHINRPTETSMQEK